MAYQYVYTSVRSGLAGARTGFCTAARHRLIPDSLVSRLEGVSSQYDRRQVDSSGNPPVIYSHRILGSRDSQYHILMRMGDAGFDHLGRANHIAHAFVFDSTELNDLMITPAEAILHMMANDRWITAFEGPPRYFGLEDEMDFGGLAALVGLPAEHWKRETSATGNAAWAFEEIGLPREIGFEMAGHSSEDLERILHLFAESLLLASSNRSDPAALWSVGFTTLLQSSLERRAFPWRGCLSGWELADEESKRHPYVELDTPLPLPDSALVPVAQGKKRTDDVHSANAPPPEVADEESREPEVVEDENTSLLPLSAGDETGEEDSEIWQERQHFRKPGCGCRSPGCVVLLIVLILGGTGFTLHHNRLENKLERSISRSDWETANRIIFNQVTAADKASSAKLRTLVTAADLGNSFNRIAASPENEAMRFLEKRQEFETWSKDSASESWRQSVEGEFLEARSRVHEVKISDLWTQAIASIEGDPESFGHQAREFERLFPDTDTLSPKEFRALVQAESEIRAYQEWRDRNCETEKDLHVYRSSAGDLRERYLEKQHSTNLRKERADFYGELAGRFGKLIAEKSVTAPPEVAASTATEIETGSFVGKQVVVDVPSDRTFVRPFHIADPSPVRRPVFDFSEIPDIEARFEEEFIYRIGISQFPEVWDPNGNIAGDRIHLRNVATPLRLSPDRSRLAIDPVNSSMDKLSERAFTLFLQNREGGMDRLIGLPVHQRERASLNQDNSEVRYCLELPFEKSVTGIAPGVFSLAGAPLEILPDLGKLEAGQETPGFEWTLIIREHEFPLISHTSSSNPLSLTDVRLDFAHSIDAEIKRLEEQPSSLDELVRWETRFSELFGDLGNQLFPRATLMEAEAYALESDLDFHSVVRRDPTDDLPERFLTWDEFRKADLKGRSEAGPLDHSFLRWVNSGLIETNLEHFARPSLLKHSEVFRKYVYEYLANSRVLKENGENGHPGREELPSSQESPPATDASGWQALDSELERAIWGWSQLTGASKNQHWERPPQVPQEGRGNREEWVEKLKQFKSDLIFSQFFKTWQEIFVPENLEVARVYLANSEEVVKRREQLVTELSLLNETLGQGDAFEDVTVCLKYVYDSQGHTYFIPLLKGHGK